MRPPTRSRKPSPPSPAAEPRPPADGATVGSGVAGARPGGGRHLTRGPLGASAAPGQDPRDAPRSGRPRSRGQWDPRLRIEPAGAEVSDAGRAVDHLEQPV